MMTFTFALSDWIARLLIALVSALIGSMFGRHLERERVLRERAMWLGYEIPCDAFDEDDLEPGHGSRSNPMCIRCGFRFSSHEGPPRSKLMTERSGAVPTKRQRNGTPIEGIPISTENETTPLEIPSRKEPRK